MKTQLVVSTSRQNSKTVLFREKWIASVQLCRPYSLLWFVCLPTVTMALWLTEGSVDVPRLALFVAAAALADAGLTTWNDACDVKTDRLSIEPQRNTRPIASGTISGRWARVQVASLLSLAVLTAGIISVWFAALLAAGIIYGLAYSARPVYAEGRPVISQLFWVVLWPAMYGVIALVMSGTFPNGWLYVVGVVLYMGIAETLAKDIRDVENDSQTGKNTTPVVFGHQRTALISATAFILGSGTIVASSVMIPGHWNPGLTAALVIVLTFWCTRVISMARLLQKSYSKTIARDLHVGSIQVFIVTNLLFIVGLTQ